MEKVAIAGVILSLLSPAILVFLEARETEIEVRKAKELIKPFLKKLTNAGFIVDNERINFNICSAGDDCIIRNITVYFSKCNSSKPNIVCKFKAEVKIDKHICVKIIPVVKNRLCKEAINFFEKEFGGLESILKT